jgi:hypothetical protein
VQILTSVVDWLDRLIGLGGLLLVVSHRFTLEFLFYGWDWKKVVTST